MIAMSLSDIAAVVGGEVDAGGDVTGTGDIVVVGGAFVDSRSVIPGGLFVAVAGEHVDGHDYALDAVAAGAAAVLGSRPTGAPTVLVDDVVEALGRLARHVREQLPSLSVIALTGSQGKTGTKDLLAQILTAHGATVATEGNFNNEIGVPLTVLRADARTRFLVVEMGARGIGHVAYLCRIARPDVAGVLNVGTAHLGEFGSREAIAEAKGEIVEGLAPEGVAVLNADDPLTAAMAARTRARVIDFGERPQSSSRAEPTLGWSEVTYDDLWRPEVTLNGPDGATTRIQLRQSGAHQVHNAAAAVALAMGVGIDPLTAASAVAVAVPQSRWRMEVHETSSGLVILNDAYNANPSSMLAALTTVAGIGRRRAGRRIAVLGEMLELGPDSPEIHRQLGSEVAAAGIEVLVSVGRGAEPISTGAQESAAWSGTAVPVSDRVQALAWLRGNLAAGDTVLVKASRDVGLREVAQALIDTADEEATVEKDEGADPGVGGPEKGSVR